MEKAQSDLAAASEKFFVEAARWDVELSHSKMSAERPPGHSPRIWARAVTQMSAYYFYAAQFVEAEARFVGPLRHWAAHAEAHGIKACPARDALPQYVQDAIDWHERVYVPKVLPFIGHFHRSNLRNAPHEISKPTRLLVDVCLGYLSASDASLTALLGFVPKTAMHWVADACKEAYSYRKGYVQSYQILEFPRP